MQHKLFFTFLILATQLVFGSNTVIKGIVSGFDNQEIAIYTATDYISNNKLTLGYAKIDNDGKFSFNYDCEKIQKVYLKIEDKTTWFYTEPGKVYNLSLSYSQEFNKQRVYDKQLSLKFNFPAPNELNQEIYKFNKKYDAFFEENYVLFVKRNRSVEPKIKVFKTKMLNETKSLKNEFVKNYILYTIALLENSIDVSYNDNATGKDSKNTKPKIYLEYLHDRAVLYNHSEYLAFFKDFFKSELKEITLQVTGLDVTKAINEIGTRQALLTSLEKYPFLQDEEFRSLFAIFGLSRIVGDKYFNQENILKLLKDFSKNGVEEQQAIAKQLYANITKEDLMPGTVSPSFELNDQNNQLISLEDFKGKHVYINFWATWNIPSQKEMKVMQVLHKKYGNYVDFVSICTDNNLDNMKKFLAKNPEYNWTFLCLEKNQKVLEDYQVPTIPNYLLLDKSLKIIKFPAGRPGGTAERATEDNIERDFFDIMNGKL